MPETVAIHHPRDPTRPTLIRADRYDPDRHHIWNPEEEPHGSPASTAASDPQRPDEEEGERADQAVGLPADYWAERSGSWYSVFAPDGTLIAKEQGKAAAVTAATRHADAHD